jgi:hypothetical protein
VVVEAKGKFFVAVKAMVSFPPKTYATVMMITPRIRRKRRLARAYIHSVKVEMPQAARGRLGAS